MSIKFVERLKKKEKERRQILKSERLPLGVATRPVINQRGFYSIVSWKNIGRGHCIP